MPEGSHACPGCGTPVGEGDNFCRRCGRRLYGAATGEEHRYVTALFSDLSGYTALAQQLDDEGLKDIMDRIFRRAYEVITGLDGTIEKFIGDAVVALFGVQRTHEDDALRAIRSARQLHAYVEGLGQELLSLIGRPLQMHTGINTGVVLVGTGAAESGALGTPINIAARLSDLAEAGEILVGESLAACVQPFFELDFLGKRHLKGLAAPVGVYRISAEREHPSEVRRAHGRVPTLIGRQAELATLTAAVKDASDGKGGVVRLCGDAGTGKSRLVHEVRTRAPDLTWLVATCYDFARGTPYAPIAGLVREILGVAHAAPQDEILRRLEDLNVSGDVFPYLAALCRGDTAAGGCARPDEWKTGVYDALYALIRNCGELSPLVICLENVQWADRSSLDLLGYLLRDDALVRRCLFIVTYRPFAGMTLAGKEVVLGELSPGETESLLCEMLGAAYLPATVVERFHKATGGNPFYLEELVAYLLSQGISPRDFGRSLTPAVIPPTIMGLVAARLDRAGREGKMLLQEAAVIGPAFSRLLLEHISTVGKVHDVLGQLECDGYITAGAGGEEYTFRHALMRDMAYASLVRRMREGLHEKIGRALEEQAFADAECLSELLAYHFMRSPDLERARRFSLMAAQRCERAGSWVEAADHYLNCEQILLRQGTPAQDDIFLRVWEGLWSCTRVFHPDRAIQALNKLSHYHRRAGHRGDEAFAGMRLVNLYSQKGLYDEALKSHAAVMELAGSDALLRACAKTAVAYTYTFLGQPDMSLKLLEDARAHFREHHTFYRAVNYLTTLTAWVWKADVPSGYRWYERTAATCRGMMDLELMAEFWLGYLSFLGGDLARGRAIFEKVLQAERKLGALAGGLSYIRTQSSIYFHTLYLGEIPAALEDLECFRALCRELSVRGAQALEDLYRGWIALVQGGYGESSECLERSLISLRDGTSNRLPYALNALAMAYVYTGNLSAARSRAQEGLEWNLRNGNQDQLVWGCRILAEVCLQSGRREEARRYLLQASHSARKNRLRPHMAWNLELWAEYWGEQDDLRCAQACRLRAASLWDEMGIPEQARQHSIEGRRGYHAYVLRERKPSPERILPDGRRAQIRPYDHTPPRDDD